MVHILNFHLDQNLNPMFKDHQLRAMDLPLVDILGHSLLGPPLEVIADQQDPQLEAMVDPQVVVGCLLPPQEGQAILQALMAWGIQDPLGPHSLAWLTLPVK